MKDNYRERVAQEVRWYRRHGKFPDQRIARDSSGVQYLIGDWAWNRGRRAATEYIEPRMMLDLRGPSHD